MNNFNGTEFAELDQDTLDDFFECYEDNVEEIYCSVGILDSDVRNTEAINRLFRAVHSLKGNLNMCLLDPMVDVVHKMEQLIDLLRDQTFIYRPTFGELFIVVCTRLRNLTREVLADGFASQDTLDHMAAGISKLALVDNDDLDAMLDKVIRVLRSLDNHTSPPESHQKQESHQLDSRLKPVDAMTFFQEMATQLDFALPYRHGRSKEELMLCFALNAHLPQPVDRQQLQAAALVHDIGMALLPDNLMNKVVSFNEDERKLTQNHIYHGYNMLRFIPGWETAASIVCQHHERYDGGGYPAGLCGDEIHTGAKILAIVDTYCSLTRERADRTFKRSVLKAVHEINRHNGVYFAPELVAIFNKVIRELYVKPSVKLE